MKFYLLNKNKRSDSTYSKIDWITIDTYLKTVPSGKLTNLLIKLQHGWWQQTASRNKLMYRSDSDDNNTRLCPLSCRKEEIKFHYLQCTHQPGYSQVVRETKSLDQYLSSRNTPHPDIKDVLIRSSIRSFLTGTIQPILSTGPHPIPSRMIPLFLDNNWTAHEASREPQDPSLRRTL